MSEQPNRLVIENKGQGPKWEKEFLLKYQQAVIDGYRIAENPHSVDSSMCNFMGFINRAVLYKPGYEPLKGEPKGIARGSSSLGGSQPAVERIPEVPVAPVAVLEEVLPAEVPELIETSENEAEAEIDPLDSLTKKKELIQYAKGLDLEVPEDMNIPAQIKKYIKDNQTK